MAELVDDDHQIEKDEHLDADEEELQDIKQCHEKLSGAMAAIRETTRAVELFSRSPDRVPPAVGGCTEGSLRPVGEPMNPPRE
jgi:hypothetical protein